MSIRTVNTAAIARRKLKRAATASDERRSIEQANATRLDEELKQAGVNMQEFARIFGTL